MSFAEGSLKMPAALLLFVWMCAAGFAQPTDKQIATVDAGAAFREIGSLPKHVHEASGLAITGARNFWTHNDGGVPILYCIDTAGNVVRSLQLNHPNSGWEDLATDKKGNLYVGGFGNNNNDKKALKIYKIAMPESITDKVYNAGIIKYSYADQHAFPPGPRHRNFDMDAFIAKGDSLYLFTKNRTEPFTGYTKIYSLPQAPGEYVAAPVDSIFLGPGPMMDKWVTSADVSPDGKTLALLSHACVWLITDFNQGKFSSGRIVRLDLDHLSHKAGIAFDGNTRLYIVDELEFGVLGGKIYSLNLKDVVSIP
jgi:hypothetical protein